MEVKTFEKHLDDAVKRKSEYSSDFKELMLKYKQGDCVRVFVESVIEEAMNEMAKEIAEAQRKACAYEYAKPFNGMQRERVLVILSTPLVTDNI